MALRGFDDYQVTLGDEMRGERASLGVTLSDVEHDLRIRAKTILAIENADLSGFPMESVVAGYVRSYARYLGMNPETSFQRFCEESGFRSPTVQLHVPTAGGSRMAINSRVGAGLTQSRFAPPAAPKRIGSVVPLGAIASVVALVAVVTGLGIGGWHLLQDIQRVGVASAVGTPESEPVAASDAPLRPMIEARAEINRPDASVYEDDGILANAGATRDTAPPVMSSRDGPISQINPHSAGVYASVDRLDPADPRQAGLPDDETADAWDTGVVLASLGSAPVPSDAERLTMSAGANAAALSPRAEAMFVHAAAEAWIRIKDGKGTVIFEGIVAPGNQIRLPDGIEAPELRAGNAGEVFVVIGDAAYGPVGKPGRVVKNVAIDADAVRATLPAAELTEPVADDTPMRRAEVVLGG